MGSYVSWVRLAVYLVVAECMLLLDVPSSDSGSGVFKIIIWTLG